MYIAYHILLSYGIVINSILIYLLYRQKHKNLTVVSLIALLTLVNIWFVPKYLTNAFHIQGYWFETLSRISALGYIFVPVIFLVFTLLYGMYYKIFYSIGFWICLILPPLIFLYLSWTTNVIGVHSYESAKLYPWGYETPTGSHWPVYMFWYDTVMLISIGILVYYYNTLVDHLRKKQALYIILAVIIPLIIATITTGILPYFGIFVFPVGLLLALMMTIIGVTVIYHYGWFELTPLTILSNINQLIITVDTRGNVLQLNPYSERILEVKSLNVIGTPIEKILHITDEKNNKTSLYKNLLKPVLNKGNSMLFDSYSIRNRKKEVFANSASITPIFAPKKGVIGANIFLRDSRQEILKLQEKDDYFNILSHELKTPISVIKAYAQLLTKELNGNQKKQRDYAMKINTSLDRLSRLINDSLELSRLTSGKFELKQDFFSINDFVTEVVETMKINYPKRKIILKGHTEDIVFADKDKIEQVLTNLVTNAIKFSPEDKKIIVSVKSNKKIVTVGVQDFGKGIESKYLKKVFDRFYQVKSNTSPTGGLGIGLYIAGTIIKSHKGKIWAESKVNSGSTFYFSLAVSNFDIH